LYVGVTAALPRRIWQHKSNLVEGYTKEYSVHSLVWYEMHASMFEAIAREKAIKKWNRDWKVKLVEQHNPDWRDLYEDIV